MAQRTDEYANMVYKEVVESGTTTLTFSSIDMGLTILQKVALLITRIEYWDTHTQMLADGDRVDFGLSASNSWVAATPGERSIITMERMVVNDHGTAANALLWEDPVSRDYTQMPGGGILIVPKPLYLWIYGTATAAPCRVQCRLFFLMIELKDAGYLELLESRQYFG